MIRTLVVLIALLGFSLTGTAQDTLVVYDLQTKKVEQIEPVPYDTASHNGQMPYSLGAMGNKQLLNLAQPAGNFYPKTQFTQPKPAAGIFDVTAFPMRAAVKIFGTKNGQLVQAGSGMMVSENMVLAAAHLFIDVFNCRPATWTGDGFLIAPAFNNGMFQELLPKSTVKKIYLFKSYYENCNATLNDVALVELHEPIGRKTGYMGIAFNDDPGYYNHKIFHKFSYPGTYDYFVDPRRYFNGDTLYYNSGPIELLPDGKKSFLGVKNAWGVGGQSGSSIFYSDNEGYYTFGELVSANDMYHYRFTNHDFYQFQHAINRLAPVPPTPLYRAALYPNPFNTQATLEFENPGNEIFTFSLFDSTGRRVQEIQNVGGSLLTIGRYNLGSGIYFYTLSKPAQIHASGKLVIE